MTLIVHKYGGTSMGSVERIKNVSQRIAKWYQAGYQMVVVSSAMSGETNRLLALAKEIAPIPDPRELDVIASTGEQVSVGLLALALQVLNIPAVSLAGWQVPVKTNSAHAKARIDYIDDRRIRNELESGKVVIVTGFQGIDQNGNITTLGRGGSDTSAVAVASALNAEECLIYTDVDGVYTTDPRVVSQARRLKNVTFEEMLEMASLGSKVLQNRSVELAGKNNLRTRVLSSLTSPDIPLEIERHSGTLITFEEDTRMEHAVISGIAFQRDEARLVVIGVPDEPGIAFKILGAIAEANIDVDMIIQNQGVEGRTDFTFTVTRTDYAQTLKILNEKVKGLVQAQEIKGDERVSKVSVVGVGMRSHAGVAKTMFKALFDEGINIQMISTSEIKISVLIDEKYTELAVRTLHKVFGLEKARMKEEKTIA